MAAEAVEATYGAKKEKSNMNPLVKRMEEELKRLENEKKITQLYLYVEGIEEEITHSIQLAVPSSDKFVEKYRRPQ